ncbi:MAG TPA: TetR/AcrR family transcriptional regulator [Candidatus Acidoferrum sp.]|jgi:AcrR family transcriptional regulator|nr:TetR/AcrR family transcriptional regulator [Candidatus Acidoferrum sp.]
MSRDATLPPTRAAVLDEIVRAAAAAFGEVGYRTATLEAIAERAGLSKVTLYRYVSSKEELLSLVVERTIDRFRQGLKRIIAERRPADDTLRRIIHYQVTLLTEHLPFLTVFFSEESGLPAPMAARAARAKREYDQAIARVVQEGVETGLLRDLPPTLVVFGLLGMCNWLHKWYRPDGKRTPAEIADVFVTLLERGYLAEPAATREDGDMLARIERRLARLETALTSGSRRSRRPTRR